MTDKVFFTIYYFVHLQFSKALTKVSYQILDCDIFKIKREVVERLKEKYLKRKDNSSNSTSQYLSNLILEQKTLNSIKSRKSLKANDPHPLDMGDLGGSMDNRIKRKSSKERNNDFQLNLINASQRNQRDSKLFSP